MTRQVNKSCPACRRLRQELAAYRAALEDSRAQLQQLQATVQRLQEQLAAARKDSSTSSQPPSSDIVKPPRSAPPADGVPRAPGGQIGHPKHERAPLPPEQVQATFEYRVAVCPDCGQALRPTGFAPRVVQQVELQAIPLRVEEHRQHESYCPCCDKVYYGPLPPVVQRGGLLGPRLTALVAYLKGVCHASYSTVRKFLRDVVGLTISRGQLAKVVAKVSAALERPYQELLERLPDEGRLNVDETGHKDWGDQLWTWCFRAELYTLFKIEPSRSADVLLDVLGREFDGVLGCDCFSAYRRYMRQCDVRVQFCLAHLIRDVKYLTTLPDRRDRAYGERLREALRHLFGVFHQREQLPAGEFRRQLQAAREEVLRQGTQAVPATAAAGRLAKRLEKYGECYFRFVTTPGVEPTNNLAEQAIRFVVLDRVVTQGTRSAAGDRWCERIWTVIASCAQQGRSVFEYLYAAVQAHFHKQGVPSLLPQQG
jgi:transposase